MEITKLDLKSGKLSELSMDDFMKEFFDNTEFNISKMYKAFCKAVKEMEKKDTSTKKEEKPKEALTAEKLKELAYKRVTTKIGVDEFDLLLVKYPSLGIAALLKECAILLDRKYSDHISDTLAVWGVSAYSRRIVEVPTCAIKCFKAISAFRTSEDARLAVKALQDYFDILYKDE